MIAGLVTFIFILFSSDNKDKSGIEKSLIELTSFIIYGNIVIHFLYAIILKYYKFKK